MLNKRFHGTTLAWTNDTGATVYGGSPVVVGANVFIATVTIADEATGTLNRTGEYLLPKLNAGTVLALESAVDVDAAGKVTVNGGGTFIGYVARQDYTTSSQVTVRLATGGGGGGGGGGGPETDPQFTAQLPALNTAITANTDHRNDAALHVLAGGTVGQVYSKTAAGYAWTDPVSVAGDAVVRAGTGAPAAAIGDDGDFYRQIDAAADANDLWGPKAGGAWPAQADNRSADPSIGAVTDRGNATESAIDKSWALDTLEQLFPMRKNTSDFTAGDVTLDYYQDDPTGAADGKLFPAITADAVVTFPSVVGNNGRRILFSTDWTARAAALPVPNWITSGVETIELPGGVWPSEGRHLLTAVADEANARFLILV